MILDEIFKSLPLKELIIIRKDGQLNIESRPVTASADHQDSPNPLFPINKERT